MPDKKLTDNEVVKALECCKQGIDSIICGECKKCPNYEGKTGLCKEDLPTVALNLINRLQEEKEALINGQETLQKYIETTRNYIHDNNLEYDLLSYSKVKTSDWLIKGISKKQLEQEKIQVWKAEAYKEFAERSEKAIFIKQDDERKQMLKILKTYRGTRTYSDTEQATDNWLRGYGEAVQDILSINNNLLKELEGE